ncbi:MAG: metallophosphoesterase family protein [Dehalococcoidia bacterium]|nr:metallophosphoesterase family protein [Dehalococcoidia bacterium]MYK25410.1 metallophosphoesterase family protein [Dehalococcoidia bacterium]
MLCPTPQREEVVRVALISDVHANLVALEAVLADAEGRGVEAIWNLGDTVGYGPDPNGVVARLVEAGAVSVLGNHDAAATGAIGTEWFNSLAAEAAEWTRAHVEPETAATLAGLGEVVREGEWSLAHGTLRQPLWEYLITEEAAEGHFALQETPYSAVGHTHVPLLVRRGTAGVEGETPVPGEAVAFGEGLLCVNPGSVGQPRDGDPRSSYALIDTEAGTVTHYRVSYDIGETQRRMEEAGLPRALAERLRFGR